MIDTLCATQLSQPSDSAAHSELTGQYKSHSSDFVVHENLGFEPSGEGEHLYLHIEKEHLTTFDVLTQLSRAYGVQERNIGYSGMKDKVAITRQWFSIPQPLGIPIAAATDTATELESGQPAGPGRLQIISTVRHAKKLRIGTHKSNGFELIIRNISVDKTRSSEDRDRTIEGLNQRMANLETRGFPNYFGPQRFGKNGNNIAKAIHHLQNPQRRIKPKLRGLYLSALRSALFNQLLAQRVLADNWLSALPGEPLMLAGSRSMFVPTVTDSQDELRERLRTGDVSTTGLLSGEGESGAIDECREFEAQALAPFNSLTEALSQAKVRADRRALRSVVNDVNASWLDDDTVQLQFSLPPGSYASMLVHHLSPGFKQDVLDSVAEH